MMNLVANANATVHMCNADTSALVSSRAIYDYPKAYIDRTLASDSDLKLSTHLHGKFVIPVKGQITDLWLDQYHHRLLWSKNADDRLLGLASVIYWGFFTFGHNFARIRVERLLAGRSPGAQTTPAMALEATNVAANLLKDMRIGAALGCLGSLSQLSRTPFASKVIALMAPSVAGVYDNRISNGLATQPWAAHLQGGIGGIRSTSVQKCYQAWCRELAMIAAQLNLGISKGEPWHWSCQNDKSQLWRALDVERALFASFGAKGASNIVKK